MKLTAQQRKEIIKKLRGYLPQPEKIKIVNKDINGGQTVSFTWGNQLPGHILCINSDLEILELATLNSNEIEWFDSDLSIALTALLKK